MRTMKSTLRSSRRRFVASLVLMILLSPSSSLAEDIQLIYYKMVGQDCRGETVIADITAGPDGKLNGILFQGFIVHDVHGDWSGRGQAAVWSINHPGEYFDLEVTEVQPDDTITRRNPCPKKEK